MRVDDYRFGRIVIDGVVYTRDVIVFPDYVRADWWRKNGHYLVEDDITEIIDFKPELLVIGRGKFGVMKVDEELMRKLKSMGIEVVAEKTDRAVEVFNSSEVGKKVGAFHLTC